MVPLPCPAELIELGPLAKPDIGDGEEVILFQQRDCHHGILALHLHPAYSLGTSPDRPHRLFMEPQALAETAGQDDLFCPIGHDYIHQLVVFPDPDGICAD